MDKMINFVMFIIPQYFFKCCKLAFSHKTYNPWFISLLDIKVFFNRKNTLKIQGNIFKCISVNLRNKCLLPIFIFLCYHYRISYCNVNFSVLSVISSYLILFNRQVQLLVFQRGFDRHKKEES